MKKSNMNLSVASVIVFGLVGCNSNLNTSRPVSNAIAKKQVTAVVTAQAAANNAASTINMIEALPGTWICNQKLSTQAQCLDGETVIITQDLQTLDVDTLNQESNSNTTNATTSTSDAQGTCNIDWSYKLAAANYNSGNSMSGTLTSTDASLVTGTQNDSACDTEISTMNKNAPTTYAATFTINSTASGNTLTLSLTPKSGKAVQKVYMAPAPLINQGQDTAPPAVTNLPSVSTDLNSSPLAALPTTTAPVVTPAVSQ
jgi:hypothetical protein